MLNLFLTQTSAPIIGWCASILAYLMQGIYWLFNCMGIENIGICIIVFTLIIKLLMFPLTLKQQKFSKVSTLMNPEIQEIQKKYQGKRDNDSMMKMQEETKAVYAKYGTSPSGGCLQMLIQMPILFSLYYIISNVPAYVPTVYDYYQPAADAIVADYDNINYMNMAYDKYVKGNGEDKYEYIDEMLDSFGKITEKKVVDSLAKYTTGSWNHLEDTYSNIGNLAKDVEDITDEQWDELISEDHNKTETKVKIEEIKEIISSQEVVKQFEEKSQMIEKNEQKIMEIYEFGPINLSQSPSSVMGIALIIPILCFLSQFISSKLVMTQTSQQMEDNPMANSMKVMNVVLPLMSAFIALSVPAGLGLYWACGGIFQIIQQIAINEYFKKVDVNDIIKANVEKMNKKKEKAGIDPNKVVSYANSNTKSIGSKSKSASKNGKSKEVDISAITAGRKTKAGSMAEKANLVSKYNEKNRK